MESLETAIRGHLDAHLSDRMSLDDFTAWLVSATWSIGNTRDEKATELTYAIELALAEHSSGFLTLDDLRSGLQAISRGKRPHPHEYSPITHRP